MNNLWLTYAWTDNDSSDVDFVIQSLESAGLNVHYDRAELQTGKRLWPQIDAGITDTTRCDAWAVYATENSLKSEACLEELAYALDRALRTRGGDFPIIGIFPRPLDRSLIPSALATRLYVSLTSDDWDEQIAASILKAKRPKPPGVPPFVMEMHRKEGGVVHIEVRPRAGRWHPGVAMVPAGERHLLITGTSAPRGGLFGMTMAHVTPVDTTDGTFQGVQVSASITAENSLYFILKEIPSKIAFGSHDTMYQYTF